MNKFISWLFICISYLAIAAHPVRAMSELYQNEGGAGFSFDFGSGETSLYGDAYSGFINIDFILSITRAILVFFTAVSFSMLVATWFEHHTWGENEDVIKAGKSKAISNAIMLLMSIIGFFGLSYFLSGGANAGI